MQNLHENEANLELVAESVPLSDFYRRLGLLGVGLDKIVVIEGSDDDIRTIQIYRQVA